MPTCELCSYVRNDRPPADTGCDVVFCSACVHDARHSAGGPPNVPVTLFEDPESPGNTIKCYIGISGCIGDTPFTAVVANACGHACFKSCKHCFLRGQTKNDQQDPLNVVRLAGYGPNATAMAQPFNDVAQWVDVPVCYSTDDNRFNEDLAEQLKVTPEQHAMRVQLAMDIRATARTDNPPPVRPANASMGSDSFETYQAGAPWCYKEGVRVYLKAVTAL